jgi:hypothetical protein
MPNLRLADLTAEIEANVRRALLEDIGSGDITAQLIPAERLAKATIITRDAAVIAVPPGWMLCSANWTHGGGALAGGRWRTGQPQPGVVPPRRPGALAAQR